MLIINMFIVNDPDSRDNVSAAQSVLNFYEHSEKQSVQYEMQRIGVLDHVEKTLNNIKRYNCQIL